MEFHFGENYDSKGNFGEVIMAPSAPETQYFQNFFICG